jgi:hypothetical protein
MLSSNMRGGKHHKNGHALSAHLLAEMGAPSHKALLRGMMSHAHSIHGGAWWDDVRNAFNDFGSKVKNEFENPGSKLRGELLPALGNEFTNPESKLRGEILPKVAEYSEKAAPFVDMAGTYFGVPGVGTAISQGAKAAQQANQGAKTLGFGRRRRAPASAGDGRRKRADIVRKVMKERGCSMIEASKIVKSEGLY